jgi:hypothetical protein
MNGIEHADGIELSTIKERTRRALTGRRISCDPGPRIDVRSREFTHWFRGSTLAEPNGEPMLFCHFTDMDFVDFSHAQTGHGFGGFYFTRHMQYGLRYGLNVMYCHLHMRNPKRFFAYDQRIAYLPPAHIAEYQRSGYDGLIYEGEIGDMPASEYVVFNSDQIKLIAREPVL